MSPPSAAPVPRDRQIRREIAKLEDELPFEIVAMSIERVVSKSVDSTATMKWAIERFKAIHDRSVTRVIELRREVAEARARDRVKTATHATSAPTGTPGRRGRDGRQATNQRPRGSRRSSERSGDSGSDSEGGSEPPSPPKPPKSCALKRCERPRLPGKRHCSDQHRLADQNARKHKSRKKQALRPLGDYKTRGPGDPVLEQLQVLALCRCNGGHLELFEAGHCDKCGHPLPDTIKEFELVEGFWLSLARADEVRRAARGDVLGHAGRDCEVSA